MDISSRPILKVSARKAHVRAHTLAQGMNSAAYRNLVCEVDRLRNSEDASATEEGVRKVSASVDQLKKEAGLLATAREQLRDSLKDVVLTRNGVDKAVAALEREELLIGDDIEELGNIVQELMDAAKAQQTEAGGGGGGSAKKTKV